MSAPDDPDRDATRTVPPTLDGARLDRAVAELFELPTASARRLLQGGRVRVAQGRRKKGDVVRQGEAVTLLGGGRWLVPTDTLRVPVLYADAELLVVDKPAGLAVHPLVPGEGGTVVDALAAHYPEIEHASPEAPREAGLVHRLDTGTSGCLVVARTPAAWRALREAFGSAEVHKVYLALVEGEVAQPFSRAEPIGHDPSDVRRMRVDPQGRAARSDVRALAHSARASMVEVAMQGGRRHQIRVHLAASGHPIVGDVLYGAGPAADAPAALLHAARVTLPGRPPISAPAPVALLEAARARGLAVDPDRP